MLEKTPETTFQAELDLSVEEFVEVGVDLVGRDVGGVLVEQGLLGIPEGDDGDVVGAGLGGFEEAGDVAVVQTGDGDAEGLGRSEAGEKKGEEEKATGHGTSIVCRNRARLRDQLAATEARMEVMPPILRETTSMRWG